MRAHLSIEIDDPSQIAALCQALGGKNCACGGDVVEAHPMMHTQDAEQPGGEDAKTAPKTRKTRTKAAPEPTPEQAKLPVEPQETPEQVPAESKVSVEALRAKATELAPVISGDKVRELIRTVGGAATLNEVPNDKLADVMAAFMRAETEHKQAA